MVHTPHDDKKKRKITSGNNNVQNWSRSLQEHNVPIVKQTLQELKYKLKTKSEPLPVSTNGRRFKNDSSQKHPTRVPEKQYRYPSEVQMPSQMTNCSSRCTKPIIVVDKQVQCDEKFELYDAFNVSTSSLRHLKCLMDKLKTTLGEEKSKKILNDMEMKLFEITIETERSNFTDFQVLNIRSKLESTIAELEQTSKVMENLCESLHNEKESLQRELMRKSKSLEEERHRRMDLESFSEKLTRELEEVKRTLEFQGKIISQFEEKNKNLVSSQKMIDDLKTELCNKVKIVQQKQLDVEYLKIEKKKLLTLSSYKDNHIKEIRGSIKELQNYLAKQSEGLRELCDYKARLNENVSLFDGGIACSSPSSSSSERFNFPSIWKNLSNISNFAEDDNDRISYPFRRNDILPVKDDLKKHTESDIDENMIDTEFFSLPIT